MEAEIRIPAWARAIASDHTGMDRDPHPVDASRVSRFTIDLPDDAYYEYAFVDGDGRLRADPGNPVRGDNPWYPEVSALIGPGWSVSPYAELGRERETGRTERGKVASEALGRERRVIAYAPAGASGPLPVALVQDGNAYFRIAGLARVLQALVDAGEARGAVLAFLEPLDRTSEYAWNDAYRAFATEEAVAWVGERFETSDERILIGASLGGLFSLTTALEKPGWASAVMVQSGAFLGAPDDRDFYGSGRSWVRDEVRRRDPVPGLRVYSETGSLEWLTEVNREVAQALRDKGYASRFQERSAGHNWTNWKQGLADGLRFVLAPEA